MHFNCRCELIDNPFMSQKEQVNHLRALYGYPPIKDDSNSNSKIKILLGQPINTSAFDELEYEMI